jgi:hypothetical protein
MQPHLRAALAEVLEFVAESDCKLSMAQTSFILKYLVVGAVEGVSEGDAVCGARAHCTGILDDGTCDPHTYELESRIRQASPPPIHEHDAHSDTSVDIYTETHHDVGMDLHTKINGKLDRVADACIMCFCRFCDRDGDGVVSLDDLVSAQAMVAQRSAEALKVMFHIYLGALQYESQDRSSIPSSPAVNKGTRAGDLGDTLNVSCASYDANDKPCSHALSAEHPAPLTAIGMKDSSKYITARHVSTVFERLGFESAGVPKIFAVLCEATCIRRQRSCKGKKGSSRKASAGGMDGDMGEVDATVCPAMESADTASIHDVSSGVAPSRSYDHNDNPHTFAPENLHDDEAYGNGNATLRNVHDPDSRYVDEYSRYGTATLSQDGRRSIDGGIDRTNPSVDSGADPDPDPHRGRENELCWLNARMDVDDFVRAAAMDDVLVRVLTSTVGRSLEHFIQRAEAEAEVEVEAAALARTTAGLLDLNPHASLLLSGNNNRTAGDGGGDVLVSDDTIGASSSSSSSSSPPSSSRYLASVLLEHELVAALREMRHGSADAALHGHV